MKMATTGGEGNDGTRDTRPELDSDDDDDCKLGRRQNKD